MSGTPSQLTVEQVVFAVGRLESDGIGNHVNWMRSGYSKHSIGSLAVVASSHFPSMEGFDPNAIDSDTTDFVFGVTVGSAVVRQALGTEFNITEFKGALTSSAGVEQGTSEISLPDLLEKTWGTCLSEMQKFTGRDSAPMIAGFSVVLGAVLADVMNAKQRELDEFNASLFAMLGKEQ